MIYDHNGTALSGWKGGWHCVLSLEAGACLHLHGNGVYSLIYFKCTVSRWHDSRSLAVEMMISASNAFIDVQYSPTHVTFLKCECTFDNHIVRFFEIRDSNLMLNVHVKMHCFYATRPAMGCDTSQLNSQSSNSLVNPNQTGNRRWRLLRTATTGSW